MMTILSLMRHGETEWNAARRWQGMRDVPLNANGRRQADEAAPYLVGRGIKAIYASDLSRAHETASRINRLLNIPLTLDARLREFDVGRWTGRTRDEIYAAEPELYQRVVNSAHQDRQYPAGENGQQLKARAAAAVDDIVHKHPAEHVLVVTHGGTIHLLLYYLAAYQHDGGIQNCSITRLVEFNGKWHCLGSDLHVSKVRWYAQ